MFSDLLDSAPAVTLLKYRRTIKESAALQRYRFEGARQTAVHDLCFNNGKSITDLPDDMAMIGTYLDARDALDEHGPNAMLDVLAKRSAWVPLTSYMGLLSNAGISLTDNTEPAIEQVRSYAVTSATAVESLLRLNEWSPWLNDSHIEQLSDKVKTQIIDRGLDVPFFRVTKAFLAVPVTLKKKLAEPLYKPLLLHFGEVATRLLPPPGPITFVVPSNLVHLSSFLLYAVLASVTETRFFTLSDHQGTNELEPIAVDDLIDVLAMTQPEVEAWVLKRFGSTQVGPRGYTYDYDAIAATLRGLDRAAPLVLDLPFTQHEALINALLPFERVFNLNTTFGGPGEICVAQSYYARFSFSSPVFEYRNWSRYSNSAAERFTETLDRMQWYGRLAEHSPPVVQP